MSTSLTTRRMVAVGGDVRTFWIGNTVFGRLPLVTLLVDLPRLGLATFQTHVAPGISWAAKANLIPSPRVSIIDLRAVLNQQGPEAVDGHLFPDLTRPWFRFRIVN